MVGHVATGIIFAVLESPKSFTGTQHVRSCLIIILNIAAREHPRAGSKQMATYQAVLAQTQSSSSSACPRVIILNYLRSEKATHITYTSTTVINGNLNICKPEKTNSYFKPRPLFVFLFVSREDDVAFSDNFLNVDFPSFLMRVSTSYVLSYEPSCELVQG